MKSLDKKAVRNLSASRNPLWQGKKGGEDDAAKEMSVREAGKKGGDTVRDRYGSTFYEEIGRKGGKATRDRHGVEFYETIGQKGGKVVKEKYGADFYEEIGHKGGQKVKKLIAEAKKKRSDEQSEQGLVTRALRDQSPRFGVNILWIHVSVGLQCHCKFRFCRPRDAIGFVVRDRAWRERDVLAMQKEQREVLLWPLREQHRLISELILDGDARDDRACRDRPAAESPHILRICRCGIHGR